MGKTDINLFRECSPGSSFHPMGVIVITFKHIINVLHLPERPELMQSIAFFTHLINE